MIHGHADVNGQEIKTASFQTYDGTLTLRSDQPFGEADKTFTGSIVTFNQTVDAMNDGVQALTLNASEMHAHGAIGGAVGGPTRLEFLHVNATSFLYDGNVTTTDDQVYNGIVNLKADGKLNGTDITFKGKVHDLDVDKWKLTATGSGTTTFEANVGDEGKRLLAVLHNGAGGLANSVFGKMIGGTPISVSTKQTQTYLNRSTLAVDLTLNASTVTFGRQPRADGQVDAKDAGQQFLLVNADAVFHGDVGKNQPLESLTVTGKTQIDTLLIKTTGNQWYQQAVTLGPAISDVDLVLNPSSTAIFGGTLDASGDGQQSLDISGNADFGQDVGEIHDLTFLTVSQDTILRGSKITTTTYQSFAGAMTLAGTLNKTLTGTTVTFGTESGGSGVRGKVDSANDGIGPRSLTIAANAVFNGNVGTQPPSIQFLDVKGNTTLTAQQITSVGFQKYQGSFTLRGTPANKQLNAASVTFGNPGAAAPFGVVDATNAGVQSLEINAANTTFNGVVGTNVAPLSLTVNGDSRINAPTIKTTSFQKYKGNVVLGPNHSDITSIPGNITTFGGTIAASASGAQGLKVDGNVQFDGDVGTVPLSYLNVVQTTLLNAKNVTTTGNQTYNGSVTLGGGGSTAEKLLTGANVLFNKSVSAQSNGVQAMTIKANQVTFNGEVGGQPPGTSKLKFLFIDADTTMNGKFITSTTYQTYDGNVTLASDMLLTGTLLTFEGTINGAKALNIDGNLATFNGDVGTGTALASMTVDAEALLNATTFKSTGVQHYLQKVTLAKAPAVNIIASSTLFDTTVDA
jgi:hypothetical protein